MNVTINPKLAMYWSIAIAVLGFLAAGVLPSYIPATIGKDIAETAGMLLGVSASIQAGLHGLSSPQAGPLVSAAAAAKADPK